MHFQRGDVNQESRTDKFVVQLMVAQNMANILAKKAFDTFTKFLHAIDVLLLHSPGAVRRVSRSRFKRFDLLLHLKIP
jgi:hypothetical protein